MDISEFIKRKESLITALLEYAKHVERASEIIIDEQMINQERKKRNLKKGNPFYYDIKQSVSVMYDAHLKRAIGYYCFNFKDEPTEVHFEYSPENFWVMLMNNGWKVTEDRRA